MRVAEQFEFWMSLRFVRAGSIEEAAPKGAALHKQEERGRIALRRAQGKKFRHDTERGKCGGHGLVAEWIVARQVQLIV